MNLSNSHSVLPPRCSHLESAESSTTEPLNRRGSAGQSGLCFEAMGSRALQQMSSVFCQNASCDSARQIQGQACAPARAGHRMHLRGLASRHRRVLEDMPCPVLQWTEHLPRHYSIDISHSSGRWLGAWGLGPAGDLEKRINHGTKGPGQGQGRGSLRSLAGPKLQIRIRFSSGLPLEAI